MKAVRELLNEIANDNSSAAVEKYSYNGLSEEQKKELFSILGVDDAKRDTKKHEPIAFIILLHFIA